MWEGAWEGARECKGCEGVKTVQAVLSGAAVPWKRGGEGRHSAMWCGRGWRWQRTITSGRDTGGAWVQT